MTGQEDEGAPEPRLDAGAEAYNAEGVDLTLIREFLARTPAERLDLVDGYAQEIEALRQAFLAARC